MNPPNRLAKINTGAQDDAFPQHYSQLTDTVNWLLRNMATSQPVPAASTKTTELTKNEAAAIAVAKGI